MFPETSVNRLPQGAIEQNMTGDQTLQKTKEMGFECDQPELEQVRQYVDQHTSAR